VVDFYCPALRLAIEVDGPAHFKDDEAIEYDKKRQSDIESLGVYFFRITNRDVYENLEGVMRALDDMIRKLE